MRRLGGVTWHTITYFVNVCDRFLERTKLSRSGARPGRELFTTRLGLGAHGGANGLVPLLPASMCEPDKAIRIALGEHHAEKCAMRKTLSGGFWIVLDSLDGYVLGAWMDMRQVTLAGASLSFVLTYLAILSFCALTVCTVGGSTCNSSRGKQLSIACSCSASRLVGVDSHRN